MPFMNNIIIQDGGSRIPLIAVVPHWSRDIPEDIRQRMQISEEDILHFTDLFVDELYIPVPEKVA